MGLRWGSLANNLANLLILRHWTD
uniref:Uncharacterized protein n=1 Tax=Arundo donax TaxID=35708 RepID=A0A0A8YSG3_ARUDO